VSFSHVVVFVSEEKTETVQVKIFETAGDEAVFTFAIVSSFLLYSIRQPFRPSYLFWTAGINIIDTRNKSGIFNLSYMSGLTATFSMKPSKVQVLFTLLRS
jgi:hypothetical protein